jgi:tetratricopeptide (TPR) repeat protein
MDDSSINGQILNELRQQTRLYRKSYIPILVILVAFLAFSTIFRHYTNRHTPQESHKESALTWNQVEDLCDKGDYEEAEKKGLIIVQKNIEDYYSHACIARIYLRKGDLPNAAKHAEIAYRLFPNKENEETLQALKKLLGGELQKPTAFR